MEDKAYTHVFYELYSKVLRLSENPSQFAEYLTLQIRELIGTRTVVIAVKTETGLSEIFSVYPERRKQWANQSAVIKLAELSFNFTTVRYIDKDKCTLDCAELLAQMEIEKIIAIPLNVGNHNIGSILLLDIMDDFGIQSIINLLDELSGVFALIIRNAHLYHEMENLVAIRTVELQDQYAKLSINEEELKALNEEYQVLNKELTESLNEAAQTNKQLVEANLRAEKSELQAREILQTAMDGFWIVDLEGKFKNVNEVACKMLGYEREELLAMHIADIEYGETGEKVKQRIEKIKKSGKDRFETKHRCKNEMVIDVEVSAVMQSSQNQLVVFTHDITERKKAEAAIKESEERYRNVIDVSPNAIIVHTEGKIVMANNAAVQAVGASGMNDLLGKSALEFVHPDDREIAVSRIMNLLQTGKPAPLFEERMIKMDGSVIEVEVAAVRTNFKGKPASLVVLRDITERKITEKALQKSNERFQLAMRASNDGLFDWNLETNAIYYSPGWKKMLGYEDHELPNDFSIWANLTEPEYVKKSWELQQNLISKQIDRFVFEFKMKHKDGYWVDILSRAEAIFSDDGKAIRIVGTHTDLSHRKKAEDALRKSEAIQSKMVANIGDVIVIIDSEGINRYKSANIEKWFGWKPEELVGKVTWGVVHPEDLNYVQQVFNTLLKEKNNKTNLEFRYQCKDGSYKWIEFTGVNLIHDKDIHGILGNYHDITERKNAEVEFIKAQEKANRYTEMILSSQSVANICSYSTNLIVADLDKSVWECSPEFYKIFGIDETYPHTIAGWAAFIHPDFRDELVKYHESVVKTKTSFNKEYKIIRINDGAERWVHGTGELAYDKLGNPVRMYGAIQDVTEIKKTEDDLIKAKEKAEESEEKYKLLYENAGVGIGYYNTEGVVISFNQSASKFMNGNPEDFIGKSIFDLFPISVADFYFNRIQKAIISTEPTVYEDFVQLPKDEKWFLSTYTKIVNSQNKVFGIQIISQDITVLKTTEIELQKAKEKAEESDRLKSAFLANMSHEIRTPMNGILGFTELLLEPDLSSEQKEVYINIVNQSGQRMLNTVNDIVEISKIEAGIVTVDLKEVDVQERLDNLIRFFTPEATKKGLKLTLENKVPKSVAVILTDQNKLDSIFTNLIKNAIKYTNSGTIKVGCEIAETQYIATLQFYVKDTGIGIPAERQQVIFERFMQADIVDKDARQGSGLGLAITKAYVEMLGGEIGLESKINEGSTFFFTLPVSGQVQQATEEEGNGKQDEKNSEIKGLNIVIAEDDENSALFLQTILQPVSSKIITAKNGNETVEACRNTPGIDLVLMDIQMPGMNGYEATRQIREFNKSVIIIAQTAFGLSGDREKALEAGCNDYISKPIRKADLLEKIRKYF